MPTGTPITVVGNLTADPESRQVGQSTVASFSVAVTDRVRDAEGNWTDGDTTFYNVSAWRELGEHALSSLQKGMRVLILGRIRSRKYTTQAGEERVSWEVEADELGPSLKYATARVERIQRNQNQAQRREQYDQQQQPGRSPATGRDTRQQYQQPQRGSAYDDETPF